MLTERREGGPAQRSGSRLPSWAFGNSGTRFKVFAQPGVPRDPYEKIADAAQVHRFTGVAPSVAAAHPVGQGRRLRRPGRATPRDQGVALGTDQLQRVPGQRLHARQRDCNPDPRVRRKAIDHLLECVDIMDATGSRDLKLWFSDGTNYPGPGRHPRPAGPAGRGAATRSTTGSVRRPADAAGVQAVRAGVLHDRRAGLGHRVRRTACGSASGPRSCVDTGHHAPGTNIEFIVAVLLRAGKLGGVRLQLAVLRRRRPDGRRGRPVPAVPDHARGRPRAGGFDPAAGIAFMLDQCHNIEPKIPAEIRSVMNVQEATAKALLVDAAALAAAQQAGDVLGANAVLMDAYNTDVRPLLPSCGPSMGLDPDPIAAYRRSGYAEQHRRRAGRRHPGQPGLGRTDAPSGTPRSPAADVVSAARSNRLGPTRATPTTPAATPRPRALATDPVDRRPGGAAVGQGLRRRPRHADRGRAGRAAAGPAAGAGRRLPGRRPRGRDGRRVRLLPARQGRRRAVHRHRHARPGRRGARGPPAPGRRASRSPPRPTARR